MAYVDAAPNIERTGVIAGFVLGEGSGRTPTLSIGVLFAQGTMYRPGSAPSLAAAPASQQSWLFYNSSSGFYWSSSTTPSTSDDAFIGWVVCDGSNIVVWSGQRITVPDPDENVTVIPLDLGAALPNGPGAGLISPPSKISNIQLAAVDYSDPAIARMDGTADLPTTLNGFDGCEIYLVIDPLGTPSDPIPVGHQYHNPADTVGPYAFSLRPPRPFADSTWRLWFVSRNATVSAGLITAAGPDQTPYVDVAITARPDTAPTQPTTGDLTLLALQYGSGGIGEPYVWTPIEVDPLPAGALGLTVWINKVADIPSEAEAVFNSAIPLTPPATLVPRFDQPASTETWYLYVTAYNAFQYGVPDGSSAKVSANVLGFGPPDQATGITVGSSVVRNTPSGSLKTFDFHFTIGDPRTFVLRLFRRWYTDDTFTTVAQDWELLGGLGGGYGVGTFDQHFGEWMQPKQEEYLGFRFVATARAQDSDGKQIENLVSPPEVNYINPASSGLPLDFVDPTTTGKGLTPDLSGLKISTTDTTNSLDNPNFEDVAADGFAVHWKTDDPNVTLDATESYSGKRSIKVTGDGNQYKEFYPINGIGVRPGDGAYVESYVKAGAGANGSAYLLVAWLDEDQVWVTDTYGTPISAGAATDWTRLAMVVQAPAGVSYMWVFPMATADCSAGAWYCDSVKSRPVVLSEELPAGVINDIAIIDSSLFGPGFTVTDAAVKISSDDPSQMLGNAGFEDILADGTVAVWAAPYGVIDTAEKLTGQQSLKIAGDGGATLSKNTTHPKISCREERSYRFKAWVKRDASGDGTAYVQLYWYDGAGAPISFSQSSSIYTPTTDWTEVTLTATAPAGASWVYPRLISRELYTGNHWWDGADLRRQIVAEEVPDGTLPILKIDAATIGDGLEVASEFLKIKYNATELTVSGGALGFQGIPLDKAIASTLQAYFSVVGGKLQINPAGITDSLIEGIAANKILAGTLIAGVVYAGQINVSQLNAGTLAANIIYSAQINASQVNAGLFNGHSLVLNLNSIETRITNEWDSAIGAYVGVRIYNATSGNKMALNESAITWKAATRASLLQYNGFDLLLSTGGNTRIRGWCNTTDAEFYIYATGGSPDVAITSSASSTKIDLVPSSSEYRVAGTRVVGSRKSGWSAATGTATRTGFPTSTVSLSQLAERVKALMDDLISHGLIGA